MTNEIDSVLCYIPVQDWLQTLLDRPPFLARSGYELVEIWMRSYRCDHWFCNNGCTLQTSDAYHTIDKALRRMREMELVEPIGLSRPRIMHVEGACWREPSRKGAPWDPPMAPAYTYGFEDGMKLLDFLGSFKGQQNMFKGAYY